jgi:hypothetical protein
MLGIGSRDKLFCQFSRAFVYIHIHVHVRILIMMIFLYAKSISVIRECWGSVLGFRVNRSASLAVHCRYIRMHI